LFPTTFVQYPQKVKDAIEPVVDLDGKHQTQYQKPIFVFGYVKEYHPKSSPDGEDTWTVKWDPLPASLAKEAPAASQTDGDVGSPHSVASSSSSNSSISIVVDTPTDRYSESQIREMKNYAKDYSKYIGTKFCKEFSVEKEEKIFEGEVVDFGEGTVIVEGTEKDVMLYTVLYEDGDHEIMDEADLLEGIDLWKTQQEKRKKSKSVNEKKRSAGTASSSTTANANFRSSATRSSKNTIVNTMMKPWMTKITNRILMMTL
jgi:hypothetical protein